MGSSRFNKTVKDSLEEGQGKQQVDIRVLERLDELAVSNKANQLLDTDLGPDPNWILDALIVCPYSLDHEHFIRFGEADGQLYLTCTQGSPFGPGRGVR